MTLLATQIQLCFNPPSLLSFIMKFKLILKYNNKKSTPSTKENGLSTLSADLNMTRQWIITGISRRWATRIVYLWMAHHISDENRLLNQLAASEMARTYGTAINRESLYTSTWPNVEWRVRLATTGQDHDSSLVILDACVRRVMGLWPVNSADSVLRRLQNSVN